MAVKTITITEEAYRKLKRMKMPDESFSELFMNVSRKKNPLREMLGILPEGKADEISSNLKKYKNEQLRLQEEKHARLRQLSSDRNNKKI